MKTTPSVIAAFAAAVLAPLVRGDGVSPTPPATSPAPNASVTVGKATITIERDGKKEVHEIDLGNGINRVVVSGGKQGKAGPVTWFGVAASEVSEEMAAQLPIDKGTGLLVRYVVPGGPAANCGLEVNDVLAKFEDQILTNSDQLRTLVQTRKAGDNVKLVYYRKGRQVETETKLETRAIGADGIAPPVIELNGGKLNLDDLVKGLKNGGAAMSIERSIIIGPDGKVTMSDSKSGDPAAVADAIKKSLEAMKQAGASDEALKSMQKALDDAVKKAAEATSKEPASN